MKCIQLQQNSSSEADSRPAGVNMSRLLKKKCHYFTGKAVNFPKYCNSMGPSPFQKAGSCSNSQYVQCCLWNANYHCRFTRNYSWALSRATC
jgi:hypothetical protein